MRVTNNMLSQNLLKNLEKSNNRMDLIQNRLSSGDAITKPSDDPVKIGIAMRIKSTITSMEQWKTNASEAISYMDTTESILGNMTGMLQRIRTLAVQGANGANSHEDRMHIAKEIDQLTHQFQVIANSQVGNRYIFSGTLVDTEPMDKLGAGSPPPLPTAWKGNSELFSFEVGANLSMAVSIDGTRLFGIKQNEDGTQSSALFQTLHKLSASLQNGIDADTQEALDEIDLHLDNVMALRSELGAKTNRMLVIAGQLDTSINSLKNNLSDVQDADIAENVMEFRSIQNIYNAALSVGAQIIQPSLVDFMR